MLKNVLIKPNQWAAVAQSGRFLNIVLAAGEIELRVTLNNDQVYATPAVQGMAMALPPFKNVQVSAKTAQQTKIWIGEIPLSYSPDTAREVGSNALRSYVGEVYSNIPTELLPAEIGRNRITLTPAADMYIGGSNLNEKNGVLLKAGEPFSMATQGAVYALEKSGEYKESFATDLTLEDVQNPTQLNSSETVIASNNTVGILAIPNQNELITFTSASGGTMSVKRVTADLQTVLDSSIPMIGRFLGYTAYYDSRGNMSMAGTAGTSTGQWITLDMETLQFSYESTQHAQGQEVRSHVSANDKYRVLYTGTIGLQVSENGAPFEVRGVRVTNESQLSGVAVTNSGVIYLLTESYLYKTVDFGATWESFLTPASMGYGVLLYNELTGQVFCAGADSGAIYTFNGADFELFYQGSAKMRVGQSAGGRVLFASDNEAVFSDGESIYDYKRPWGSWVRTLGLTSDGRAYVRWDAETIIAEGKQIRVGGLPVAIMAEVN